MAFIEEKNLKVWKKANGGATASLAELQDARSAQCRPSFLGDNVWVTPSTTRTGEIYTQEVYFAGYCDRLFAANEITPEYSHGFLLHIDCSCPATKVCKHALAIQRKYEANYGYLFDLFGLSRQARFADLYGKAHETYLRMRESNSLREAA